jgi:hypothetical protein
VIALAMLATAALTAAAPSPVRVDRDAGVRFHLQGTVLTASLVRPDLSDELWGKRIRAVCSPVFGAQARFRAVHEVETWPEGATELSYTFKRDVSERVKWCLLEDADGGGDVAAVQFQVFFPVYGDSAKDKRIGRELRSYLWFNVGDAPWMRKIRGIVVQRGVIAVATELRRDRYGKRVARDICNLIQGSDVADFTPGHTVFGHDDVRLRRCRARPEVAARPGPLAARARTR